MFSDNMYAKKSKFVLEVINPVVEELGYGLAMYVIEDNKEEVILLYNPKMTLVKKVYVTADSNLAMLLDTLKAVEVI